MPNLQLRCYYLRVWIFSIDVAKIDQLIARNSDFLPWLEHSILLHLEEARTNHSQREHHQAQVYKVTAVALPVALEEHVQRKGIWLPVEVPHAHTAPHSSEHRADRPQPHPKAHLRPS